MKKSITAKITALALACAMLFTACSNKSSSDVNANVNQEMPQQLKVAISTTFSTLDPALMSTTHMSNVYSNLTANLFAPKADGSQEKLLCEDYSISDDGLTYKFTIKQGVLWSDGVELTSEHFIYAIKRAIGYGAANAYAVRNLTGFIEGAKEAANDMLDVKDMTDVGVKEIDKYTFEVQLKTPCPYFIQLFRSGVTSPLREDFAPEHESAWSLTNTYPTLGAFTISSINPEEEAICVKNENYINAKNVNLEKLTFTVMPDSSAQLNAFKAGQIDIALSVPSEVAVNSQYENQLFKGEKYASSYFVCVNTGEKGSVEGLKDANVRKALAMAIDKDTMVTILNSGDYITPLYGFIPYGFTGETGDFRSEATYLEYNLEKAKQLMEQAGYTQENPLEFEYLYSNNQFHADVAQMLQQFWAQINVKVTLKSVEGGVFYDFVDNGDFQTSRYANNEDTDPLNYFKVFTSDAQIEGCQAIADETYDKLVSEAFSITDPVEYAKQLHKIEDYMVGEMAYVLPLFTQTPVILVQENVEGFWTTAGGITIYMNTKVN